MEQGQPTFVNRSERTLVNDPEKTAVVPRFGESELRQAKPAVPLGEIPDAGRRRRVSSPLLALAIAAGLTGGVLGGVGTALYQRNSGARTAVEEQGPSNADVPVTEARTDDAPPVAIPPAADGEAFVAAKGASEGGTRITSADAGGAAGAETQAELRGALEEWIAATNARDINRQMNLYDSRLGAFYLSRDASREAVRAEKRRVFERASSVDVRASGAAIRVSPDGRTATMRFRKHYAIEGGGIDRRGEVVQELRWRRTPQGWKIVSERDVRVID